MGDFGPVVAAIITTAGAILVASITASRLRKPGLGNNTQIELNRNLRELAETEKVKGQLWHEKFDAEVLAHSRTRQQRDQAQYDADTCQRRLDNAYADMRLESQTKRDEKVLRPGETLGSGETGTK